MYYIIVLKELMGENKATHSDPRNFGKIPLWNLPNGTAIKAKFRSYRDFFRF